MQKDIIDKLGLTTDEVKIFHQGIERPNLRLEAVDVWGDDDKMENILKAINSYKGSTIIYFSLIKYLARALLLIKPRLMFLRIDGLLSRIFHTSCTIFVIINLYLLKYKYFCFFCQILFILFFTMT